MKKGIRNRMKIIEILKEGDLNGSQIQSRINNGKRRHGLSINEITMLCRTTKEIEKKCFDDSWHDSKRVRQVIWGLKE